MRAPVKTHMEIEAVHAAVGEGRTPSKNTRGTAEGRTRVLLRDSYLYLQLGH